MVGTEVMWSCTLSNVVFVGMWQTNLGVDF
jgi:hypothetical protein